MNFNYQQICLNLLKNLPNKQKEVLARRFGLKDGRRETLESIGRDFGVTRERIRQIEEDGFLRLKPEVKRSQRVFQYFKDYFKKKGGLKKEEILLEELAGKRYKNQASFLLTLGEDFQRTAETADFHPFWAIDQTAISQAEKVINSVCNQLKKSGRPLIQKNLVGFSPSNQNAFVSFLEISKKIQRNTEGLYGLKTWPEINPRGVKDKAFLVFKKEEKPLHFSEVASLIGSALPQTVHNELIKDPRFVLVGRGLYALSEWGYEKGAVKDIISKILENSARPLSREEILEKTLKQRLVKENTILLNLSNRKYFLRTSGGKYQTKKA